MEVKLEIYVWMSRSPAKSGKATAMKLLKEKWLSMVQLMREKGENGIGGFSTVTLLLFFVLSLHLSLSTYAQTGPWHTDSIHTWTSPGWFCVGSFQVPSSGSTIPKMVPQLSHAQPRRNWHTISNCFWFFLCPSKTRKHQKHREEQLLYLFNF